MDLHNISYDWIVDNIKAAPIGTFVEISLNGSRLVAPTLPSKKLCVSLSEAKSPVFPKVLEAGQNAGYWCFKLIVSLHDVTLKLCLAQGEISNYYSSYFEVNLFSKNGVQPWISCSGKSLFHGVHNQEYNFKKFITKNLLNYFINDDSTMPIKISCKMHVKVEKCIINAAPKEIPDFEKLLNDPEFSDFMIVTSENKFKVHKMILAARSEVFSAMIKNEMREKTEGIVKITDFSDEVVQELLRYIYCGKVQYLDRLSEELLRAADKYSVDGLKSICLEEICKKLSVENALDLLSLLDYHKVDYLKANILNFIVINIKKYDQSQFKLLENSKLSNEILFKVAELMT